MKDEINQDSATWDAQVKEMNRLSQRAAKLSERGAHYFVGWLIGAGMHNAAMMAEFEKVLARLETDTELSHCWRSCENATVAAAPAETAAEMPAFSVPGEQLTVAAAPVATEAISTTDEKPAITAEAPLASVLEDHVNDQARSGMVKFEAASAAETQERQGFFAKIFRRQRIAA